MDIRIDLGHANKHGKVFQKTKIRIRDEHMSKGKSLLFLDKIELRIPIKENQDHVFIWL